ncbi:MAG TPA: glycosyltransferase [Streptosporangiaceae bacterium]
MNDLKISIAIPYKRRLHNIKIVLASLADQTMDASEFEVIVGAMEYSPEYVAACAEFAGRLNLVSVMVDEEWNFSRARNLALRHASGEIILVLDADMALPSNMLQTLYDRHFADQQNVCVLGQMIGYSYDMITNGVASVEELPYDHYRGVLAELESMGSVWTDERCRLAASPTPWTMVFAAMVALPAATVRRHGLMFDEAFRGWGAEDQEWGYRIHRTGTPIILADDVYGLHLPHLRTASRDLPSLARNKGYFLAKWPSFEVELFRKYDLDTGLRLYLDLVRELAAVVPDPGHTLGIVRGTVDGAAVVAIGAVLDEKSRVRDPAVTALFDVGSPLEVLPLVGIALPYSDKSIHECRILPSIGRLSAQFRDAVSNEAARVAHATVQQPLPDHEIAAGHVIADSAVR